MTETRVKTENITIVLNGPKFPGNVGSAARCAMNMGVEKIFVVGEATFPVEDMKQMSTHVAAHIVDGIRYFSNLGEALAGFRYIVGTTARVGAGRGPNITPRQMGESLVAISQNNEIALLFGCEDKGLSNDDLRYCHAVVNIPTSEGMTSLNLSHAVMILCYEAFTANAEVTTRFPQKLASAAELEGMYHQLKETLIHIDYVNPENPDYWMTHIRRMFARTGLFAREVKIIRGICRQIEWYGNRKNT